MTGWYYDTKVDRGVLGQKKYGLVGVLTKNMCGQGGVLTKKMYGLGGLQENFWSGWYYYKK